MMRLREGRAKALRFLGFYHLKGFLLNLNDLFLFFLFGGKLQVFYLYILITITVYNPNSEKIGTMCGV